MDYFPVEESAKIIVTKIKKLEVTDRKWVSEVGSLNAIYPQASELPDYTEKLVKYMLHLTDRYYNDGVSEVDDWQYKRLEDVLGEIDPKHPLLKKVGAEVNEGDEK